MVHVKGDITIARTAQEVFDFVADERNEPRYNPQMTSAEMVTRGPIGVGSRFHSVMTGVGRGADMMIELTEFDRPRRLASTTHMSSMDINGVLLFEPVSQGTRMTWRWDIQPHGIYKLLGPIVHRIGQKQELSIWTGLKRVMEADSQTSQIGLS